MKKLHQNDSSKAFECFSCMTVSTGRYTLAYFKEQSGKRYTEKICESCAVDTFLPIGGPSWLTSSKEKSE
tara:strand:- start:514 stop:723 length:210 start_codon:yes stop_codon:yes gene_type:complete